jgi:hypothetical protein
VYREAPAVAAPSPQRCGRRKPGGIEAARHQHLVTNVFAERAEDTRAQLSPGGRQDQAVGERALHAGKADRIVGAVHDSERHHQQPGARPERRVRRQLDEQLLDAEQA